MAEIFRLSTKKHDPERNTGFFLRFTGRVFFDIKSNHLAFETEQRLGRPVKAICKNATSVDHCKFVTRWKATWVEAYNKVGMTNRIAWGIDGCDGFVEIRDENG